MNTNIKIICECVSDYSNSVLNVADVVDNVDTNCILKKELHNADDMSMQVKPYIDDKLNDLSTPKQTEARQVIQKLIEELQK